MIEWIPVTEQLPEKSGHYLVTLIDDDNGEPWVSADDYFVYGWDDFGDEVVAWAEPPEPYRGLKNETEEVGESKVSRKPFLTDEELRRHIKTVGEQIKKDAETLNIPAYGTKAISIFGIIAPEEQVTSVKYIVNRNADPRLPREEYERKYADDTD